MIFSSICILVVCTIGSVHFHNVRFAFYVCWNTKRVLKNLLRAQQIPFIDTISSLCFFFNYESAFLHYPRAENVFVCPRILPIVTLNYCLKTAMGTEGEESRNKNIWLNYPMNVCFLSLCVCDHPCCSSIGNNASEIVSLFRCQTRNGKSGLGWHSICRKILRIKSNIYKESIVLAQNLILSYILIKGKHTETRDHTFLFVLR